MKEQPRPDRRPTLALVLSALSFIVASASGIYTGTANYRLQENLSIKIKRSVAAGLSPTTPKVFSPDFESSNALLSKWSVSISNVSNSATTYIEKITILTTQFSGLGIWEPNSYDYTKSVGDLCRDVRTGSALSLPIKLDASSSILLECSTTITLDKNDETHFRGGLPAGTGGAIVMFRDIGGDMFGNKGREGPDGSFATQNPASVKQAHLTIKIETTRGYIYTGSADWYWALYQITQ